MRKNNYKSTADICMYVLTNRYILKHREQIYIYVENIFKMQTQNTLDKNL